MADKRPATPSCSSRKKKCPDVKQETDTEGSSLPSDVLYYENPNPLLNELVLDSVFKYLGGNDLKACRLVSKKWNSSTIPFTRSRLQVTIWGTRMPETVACTFPWGIKPKSTNSNPIPPSEQIRGIENFMTLMEANTLGIPFGSYRIGPFDTTEGPGQKFLELCRNTAKEICLDRSIDHMVENVSELLKSSPKMESFVMPLDMNSSGGYGTVVKLFPDNDDGILPKLISLKSLDVSADYANKRKEICPTFFSELIGVAENISTLNLRTWFNCGPHDSSLEILEIIDTLGREKTITKLKLGDLSPAHLGLLEKMARKENGLKLKELDLMVTRKTDTFARLYWFKVVKLFKNSLICLSINSTGCSTTSIEFPNMPILAKLKLEVPERTILRCENKDFNLTFPALKKFNFFLFGGGSLLLNNFITSEEGSQMQTMDSIILRHSPTLDIRTLDRFRTIFPKLTMLEFHVRPEFGADVIKKIWTQMIQLQSLNIYGTLETKDQNLDSLITGMNVEKINELTPFSLSLEKKNVNSRTNLIWMEINKYRTLPSIRNLTNLKSLSLDLCLITQGLEIGTKEQNSKYLTDLSAYFGFYWLKNLQHLSLSNSAISKNCSEILVKDMELISWKFKSPSKAEIIPIPIPWL